MKPYNPCPKHPDSEAFFTCRYCEKIYCEICCQKEPGFYRCRNPECLRAFQAEAKAPPKTCAHCGYENQPISTFCGSCGEAFPPLSPEDPNSLITVTNFLNIAEAELARTNLLNQGIESSLSKDSVYASQPTGLGRVRLQTRAGDAGKAASILALDSGSAYAGACLYCGRIVPLSESDPDSDIVHCRQPECLAAHQADLEKLPSRSPSAVLQRLSTLSRPQEEPLALGWVILLWLTLWFLETTPSAIFSGLEFWLLRIPDSNSVRSIFWFSEAACLVLVLYWTKRFHAFSWQESIRFLGFKAPDFRQILAAILILVPILAGRLSSLEGYQKEGVLVLMQQDWKMHSVSILIGAGFFEETLYRGFLFRLLRRGRSFFPAATLSAALWSLSHVSQALPYYGPDNPSFHSMVHLMFMVFVDGLLAAYLFEKGGFNIWGWMLIHVGYDSCLLFNTQGGDFYASESPETIFGLSLWLSWFLSVPIIFFLMPARTGTGGAGNSSPGFQADGLIRRWRPKLSAFVGLSTGILVLFLANAPLLAGRASDLLWGNFLKDHPRYADGWRKWAYHFYTLGRYGDAEEKCGDALDIDPRNSKSWLLWGRCLVEDGGRYRAAILKFEEAAQAEPRKAACYLWWGYALEKNLEKKKALEKYKQVLALKPDEFYFIQYAAQKVGRLKSQLGEND